MTLTARQLRQLPTIKAIERVPYFANVYYLELFPSPEILLLYYLA